MPYQKELELFANRKPTVVGRVPELALRRHFTRREVFGNPELPTSITVATVGGESYTGKTGFAESLGKQTKLGKDNIFLVGNFMREAKKTGQIAQGTFKEDQKLDEASDAIQKDMILTSNRRNPKLLESRLAALLAKNESREHQDLNINSVSVLLLATPEKRKQRALQRTTINLNKRIKEITAEIRDLEEAGAEAILIDGAKTRRNAQQQMLDALDINVLWEEELRRQREDEEEYRRIYPWLSDYEKYYMDPELTDEHGNRVYDIVINTDTYTPEEVYNMVCEEIIKFRKEKEDIGTIVHALDRPEETVVYPQPTQPL